MQSERQIARARIAVLSIALASCGTPPAGGGDATSPRGDATAARDAGSGADSDAGTVADAPPSDVLVDAGAPEAGVTCPTAPPFDPEAPGIRERCTRVVYVAAGYAIRRIVSYDGHTFTHDVSDPQDGAHQDEHQITGLAIGRGIIVAAGDGGLWTSVDGETWVPSTYEPFSRPFALHSARIAFANNQFYIAANGGTFWSSDGVHWDGVVGDAMFPGTTVRGSFNGHVHAWAAGNGRVVFANDDTRLRVFDGTSWSDARVGMYSGWIENLAFGAGRFVATGDACCGATAPTAEGLRAHSTDAVTWQDVATNASAGSTMLHFGALFWDGARFVATGGYYGTGGLTSTDGVSWTPLRISHNIGALAHYEATYLGSDGHSLYTSSDGVSWTEAYHGASTSWWLGAVAVGRILNAR